MFSDRISYKKERILRILVHLKNGSIVTGSGFFINNNAQLLTCFHVVFGEELRNIRTNQDFISITGDNEHSKLGTWFTNKINKIEVEFSDTSKEELGLKKFDEKFDIALLELKNEKFLKKIKYCQLNFKDTLRQGDLVFFAGFPICFPYKNTDTPFAINTGMVSSFPETIIGGEKYEHVQINSINLGGNSGAPLFRKNRDKVIGIINGNLSFKNDNVLFQNPQNNQTIRGSLQTPLSIAYATPLKLLKISSTIFTPDRRRINRKA